MNQHLLDRRCESFHSLTLDVRLLGCGVEPATIHIIPILCRNIEAAPQVPRLADTTFKAIAKSAGLIPSAAMRAHLLPRIFVRIWQLSVRFEIDSLTVACPV